VFICVEIRDDFFNFFLKILKTIYILKRYGAIKAITAEHSITEPNHTIQLRHHIRMSIYIHHINTTNSICRATYVHQHWRKKKEKKKTGTLKRCVSVCGRERVDYILLHPSHHLELLTSPDTSTQNMLLSVFILASNMGKGLALDSSFGVVGIRQFDWLMIPLVLETPSLLTSPLLTSSEVIGVKLEVKLVVVVVVEEEEDKKILLIN